MFKLVHWINDNLCELTNIEWTDTGAEQPIIFNWYNNWANSIIDGSHDHIDQEILAIFLFPVVKSVLVLLLFHEHGDNSIITWLNTISKLLPHYGYFLKNVVHSIF